MPVVSVIVPVCNAEAYLRQCLDSVLGQTLRDLEVVCVDDGSADSSAAILAEYAAKDCRVKVLTQANAGSGAARNRGIDAACGRYVAEGMEEQAAEVLSQQFNIFAMLFFICSRFIATFLMRWVKPARLLAVFAVLAMVFTLGVIIFQNRMGLYCLVCVSGCMSLMFPTIYGIALDGMGDDAKFGAAGLIMAILGGSVLPPLQAMIIDQGTVFGNFPATNFSFILPLFCFLVVYIYGMRTAKIDNITNN